MPDFQDVTALKAFKDIFVQWFNTHVAGTEEIFNVLPGFEGLNQRQMSELPAAQVSYSPDASYVRVSTISPMGGIIQGSPHGLKNALDRKKKQLRGNRKGMSVIAIDMARRADLSVVQMAPAVFANQPPEAVEEFFNDRTTRHISGIHLSQMNIFSRTPLTPTGWINPYATIRNDDVVRRVFIALSG